MFLSCHGNFWKCFDVQSPFCVVLVLMEALRTKTVGNGEVGELGGERETE